eukprot:m.306014 g.306014  ORF g.306014 m.306014 type:complete len:90 (+) comp19617_c0_seq1:226-495(+)
MCKREPDIDEQIKRSFPNLALINTEPTMARLAELHGVVRFPSPPPAAVHWHRDSRHVDRCHHDATTTTCFVSSSTSSMGQHRRLPGSEA